MNPNFFLIDQGIAAEKANKKNAIFLREGNKNPEK